MRIVRVEYNGGGMYRDRDDRCVWVEVLGDTVVDAQAHPIPQDDSGLGRFAIDWLHANQPEARFGFESLAQLRRWLYRDEWVVALSGAGCEVVEYETDGELFVGYTQAIFNIRYATEVSRKPLASILEQ